MNRVCLTLDIDWASDEIIAYCVEILKEYGCKATIFATGKSPLLEELSDQLFEIGIHPNFNGTSVFTEKVDELLEIYPNSIGMRSHGLFSSSNILLMCREKGIKYDCNTILPYHTGLYPVERFPEFYSIPYNWSDDNYLKRGLNYTFDEQFVKVEGLKLFTFHPIHLYMNTFSPSHYSEYKVHYQSVPKLAPYRNEGNGIKSYFIQLLKYLKNNNIQTWKCSELIDQNSNNQ
jgi:hypothetical protein